MRLIAWLLSAAPVLVHAQISPEFLARVIAESKPSSQAFSFAAIGDQQYGEDGERKWPALAQSLNAAARQLKFVIHVGDIKSGSTPCTDAMFANRAEAFAAIRMPMILTPGDNEWTDCHRETAGQYDPLERLSYLRKLFFSSNQSLGHPSRTLFRQSEDPRYALYVENALWTQGNVVFATVNVIGSDNNLGRNAANDREFAARNPANLEWIRTAFRVATERNFVAVVLAFQADPFFPITADATVKTTPGFVDTLRVLETETIRFRKPVLVIHGDSHYFRFDKPLSSSADGRELENFFRLEIPGETSVHWVQVNVDPTQPDAPFVVAYKNVRANYVDHPLPK